MIGKGIIGKLLHCGGVGKLEGFRGTTEHDLDSKFLTIMSTLAKAFAYC